MDNITDGRGLLEFMGLNKQKQKNGHDTKIERVVY